MLPRAESRIMDPYILLRAERRDSGPSYPAQS